MSERDTQFAGFAKLLWDEMVAVNSFIDVNDELDGITGIDPVNYRLIIAQRAYDLVNHTCDRIEQIEDLEERFWIGKIPDITKWPEGK